MEVLAAARPLRCIFDIASGRLLHAIGSPGRLAILEVHAKDKPLAGDVILADLARQTAGFSGADLANLLNEAALLAARRGYNVIHKPELEEAVLRVMAGPERKR